MLRVFSKEKTLAVGTHSRSRFIHLFSKIDPNPPSLVAFLIDFCRWVLVMVGQYIACYVP